MEFGFLGGNFLLSAVFSNFGGGILTWVLLVYFEFVYFGCLRICGLLEFVEKYGVWVDISQKSCGIWRSGRVLFV